MINGAVEKVQAAVNTIQVVFNIPAFKPLNVVREGGAVTRYKNRIAVSMPRNVALPLRIVGPHSCYIYQIATLFLRFRRYEILFPSP
jgi:hypothetical protein